MPQEVTEALSGDERTILEIAAGGGPVAAIGRWEKPALALERRGYLEGDNFNLYLTEAGRAAFDAAEKENDRAIGRYIETASRVTNAQQEIAQLVEQAAALMATAALRTAEVRDVDARSALANWITVMTPEAMSLIREKQRAITG